MRDVSIIINLEKGVTLILLKSLTITQSEESMTKKKDSININRVLETIGTWVIKSLALILKINMFKIIKRGHNHPTTQNPG